MWALFLSQANSSLAAATVQKPSVTQKNTINAFTNSSELHNTFYPTYAITNKKAFLSGAKKHANFLLELQRSSCLWQAPKEPKYLPMNKKQVSTWWLVSSAFKTCINQIHKITIQTTFGHCAVAADNCHYGGSQMPLLYVNLSCLPTGAGIQKFCHQKVEF